MMLLHQKSIRPQMDVRRTAEQCNLFGDDIVEMYLESLRSPSLRLQNPLQDAQMWTAGPRRVNTAVPPSNRNTAVPPSNLHAGSAALPDPSIFGPFYMREKLNIKKKKKKGKKSP
ncbi:unnamed protein product [Tetraodon nigroviridis]|uniref:(spotted green pufferfish) hypothetical protein n=1 Tax=Tetraodon nigroviridis TaxID=99883 RepID=Q4SF42_TETNG|nr:unnamed protein product [Tetraodon nigroviridis]